MHTRAIRRLFCALLAISLLSVTVSADNLAVGAVEADNLRLRAAPSTQAESDLLLLTQSCTNLTPRAPSSTVGNTSSSSQAFFRNLFFRLLQ